MGYCVTRRYSTSSWGGILISNPFPLPFPTKHIPFQIRPALPPDCRDAHPDHFCRHTISASFSLAQLLREMLLQGSTLCVIPGDRLQPSNGQPPWRSPVVALRGRGGSQRGISALTTGSPTQKQRAAISAGSACSLPAAPWEGADASQRAPEEIPQPDRERGTGLSHLWCGRSGSWNAETEVRTERLKLRESVYFQETEVFIGGARVGSSDSCYVGAAAASV